MKNKYLKLLGIMILVVAIGGTTIYANGKGAKVNTATVQKGSITQYVEVEGHIETEDEKSYYAKVSAPVEQFELEIGDVVEKGQMLVVYDTEDFERNVEQARLQAEALQNGYEGSVSQSRELRASYKQAVEQDAAYKEAYEATLNNVNQLQYNINVVDDFIDDQAREIEEKIAQVKIDIAQKQAQAADYDDDDRYDYAEQAAQLEIKLARLEKELEGLPKTGAKPEEDKYFKDSQMYMNEITTQRGILQQEMITTEHAALNASQLEQMANQAALAGETLQWNQEEARKAREGIVSDITGVISDIGIEEGAYVQEGTKIFTIKDIEHVKAVVEVTKREMSLIEVGQSATISIAGRKYDGVVSKIRMEAVKDSQNKAKLQVEIHINAPENDIYLGTDIDASIQTGASEDALLLNNAALYADDNGDYCYLNQNGHVEKRYIVCGLSDGTMTEVLDGLSEGDEAIISSMTDASIGMKVSK